ncbi:hypothetical protein DCF38_13180 [Edwardsiella piscicida]|uniref:hypothetical protein n=1 Tax=Edwardsiella piscicida TaxID=1263550 RepID=UPI001CF3A1F5|nr:hypothetical protein [Edwardsiella piscicida]UCQ40465.1 hypothetical protein DCF38_13180 [Edwardsiella piscicida]
MTTWKSWIARRWAIWLDTIDDFQHIVTSARQFSDEDSSDAGRRLRRRQDDLVLLEKAEYLVKNLSQLPLNFEGGTSSVK